MGRKKCGKKVPKPTGRPRKGFRCDGSGIKLSAAIERPTMDAGCRLYDMGLQLPSSQHEEAKRHACKRVHQFHLWWQRSVPTAIQPPKHHSKWAKWLRESVSSTEASANVKAARPFVLSRTLFHEGSISTECERLGRLWVAFWAVGRVRSTFCAARGFGLVVAIKVAAGQVMARGLLEADFDEPCYTVLGGGTMYGPAALTNASCSERCANAIFSLSDHGVWEVVAKRTIDVGEEVIVHYPSVGECVCGASMLSNH